MSNNNPFAVLSPDALNLGAIAKALTYLAQRIRSTAIELAPTQRIKGAVQVGKTDTTGLVVSSEVVVDILQAPEAAAFEFGSGLHATRGTPGKYDIRPNQKKKLVFHWENEPEEVKQKFPHTKDGKIILGHVAHPGVLARPYLKPAGDSIMKSPDADSIIGKALVDGFDKSDVNLTLEIKL